MEEVTASYQPRGQEREQRRAERALLPVGEQGTSPHSSASGQTQDTSIGGRRGHRLLCRSVQLWHGGGRHRASLSRRLPLPKPAPFHTSCLHPANKEQSPGLGSTVSGEPTRQHGQTPASSAFTRGRFGQDLNECIGDLSSIHYVRLRRTRCCMAMSIPPPLASAPWSGTNPKLRPGDRSDQALLWSCTVKPHCLGTLLRDSLPTYWMALPRGSPY